jgi:malate dehydrogenase (oxaloacetate-decarboxylating)
MKRRTTGSVEIQTPNVWPLRPSPSYSFTIRVRVPERGGEFADVARVIAEAEAVLGAIELLDVEEEEVIRDVTVKCADAEHSHAILSAIGDLDRVRVDSVCDRAFLFHEGGTIEVKAKRPPITRDQLSMAYAPEVGRVAMAIHEDPAKAWALTIKHNTVAVVSDGTAVRGLGNVGPAAAMPVIEGKALLLKELAGVDAFPLCLDTTDVDQIVACVKAIAPTFGAINLEGIAAPRCVEIERRLRAELEIPVFHDDQHGTAIVVLAALLNALRVLDKQPQEIKAVVLGAGAAGIASTEILLAHGITDVVVCERHGALHPESDHMNPEIAAIAACTNPRGLRGGLDDVLVGADLLLSVSAAGAVSRKALRTMAPDAIVFALANPTPELRPGRIPDNVAIIATGRTDYPNQINNALAFPGVFKGALNVRASTIDDGMKLAAASAIANIIPDHQLDPQHIIPTVFNHQVLESVAQAVAGAAITSGAGSRRRSERTDPNRKSTTYAEREDERHDPRADNYESGRQRRVVAA